MRFSKHALLVMLSGAFIALGAAPTTQPKIVDRFELKLPSSTRPASAPVDTIVLHFSSDCVQHPNDPFNVERVLGIYKKANVSAHYLIDRDGNVLRLVDEKRAAFHAGRGSLPWDKKRASLNTTSIGIEMLAVGSEDDMVPLFMSSNSYRQLVRENRVAIGFTEDQYASLNWLIEDIRSRWPDIKHDDHHIIGHEDWAGRDRRTDPGLTFQWERIGLPKRNPLERTHGPGRQFK